MERARMPTGTRVRFDKPPILLMVAPGKPGARGTLYHVTLDGEEIAKSVRPFFDSARVLRERGEPEWRDMEMQYIGSPIIAMRAAIGWAAARTIVELKAGGISRKIWQPFYITAEEHDGD